MANGKYEYWLSPDGLTRLEAYARDGLTDELIAGKMGITPSTYYEWKKKFPEISESLKRGKEIVDVGVENKLLKRANGYEYEEVTKELVILKNEYGEVVKDANGAVIKELAITKIVKKEVIPDTTAQIFWLKNRKAAEWRDKTDVEISGTLNNPYKELTEDELRKLANKKGR
jgi:hypothetical protein